MLLTNVDVHSLVVSQRVRCVQVRLGPNADAESFNQLAAKPAAHQRERKSSKRTNRRLSHWPIRRAPTQVQTNRKQNERDVHYYRVIYANTLRTRAAGNVQPIDEAKQRRDDAADESRHQHPKRNRRPRGVQAVEIKRVKN